MPGVERLSISAAVEEAGRANALGLGGVLLFGMGAEAVGASADKRFQCSYRSNKPVEVGKRIDAKGRLKCIGADVKQKAAAIADGGVLLAITGLLEKLSPLLRRADARTPDHRPEDRLPAVVVLEPDHPAKDPAVGAEGEQRGGEHAVEERVGLAVVVFHHHVPRQPPGRLPGAQAEWDCGVGGGHHAIYTECPRGGRPPGRAAAWPGRSGPGPRTT